MNLNCETMAPGEYKKAGEGLTIYYGTSLSPFGGCLIATTNRGICKLEFFDTPDQQKILEKELHHEWSRALMVKDEEQISALAKTIFTTDVDEKKPLTLLLKGTPFQLKVWEALLSIPSGDVVAYQEVATAIGAPAAVRAVASAIAKNNIAYIIPCHRVIRKNGDIGQYRWSTARKKALIAWEVSR